MRTYLRPLIGGLAVALLLSISAVGGCANSEPESAPSSPTSSPTPAQILKVEGAHSTMPTGFRQTHTEYTKREGALIKVVLVGPGEDTGVAFNVIKTTTGGAPDDDAMAEFRKTLAASGVKDIEEMEPITVAGATVKGFTMIHADGALVKQIYIPHERDAHIVSATARDESLVEVRDAALKEILDIWTFE